ncbi:MAG: histidine utilization repressor, partial [Agrobacterium tumefaciens]
MDHDRKIFREVMPPISEDARDAQGTEDQNSPLYVKLKDYVRSRVEA